MLQKFVKIPSKDSSAWNVLLAYTSLLIINNIIVITFIKDIKGFNTLVLLRLGYVGAMAVVFVLLFKLKYFWTEKRSTIVFVLLYLPNYIFNWMVEHQLNVNNELWVPLTGFRFQIILLAFLVPSRHRINLVLMLVLCLEALITWFYFDIPHQPYAVKYGEPYRSFIYAITGFTILAFRYRDKQLISKLISEKTKSEVHEAYAKMFLSMRDKTNTPLQTQKLSIALLKKQFPDKISYFGPLENSVDSLTRISNILTRLEKNFPIEKEELMSEQEIIDYLDKIEGKK